MVSTPLKNVSSSVGMIIPNMEKYNMFQTTNQIWYMAYIYPIHMWESFRWVSQHIYRGSSHLLADVSRRLSETLDLRFKATFRQV